MRMLKPLVVIVAVVVLSGPLSAHANIIYNWTGDCQLGCVGQATMHVETTDAYQPGAVMDYPLLATRYTDSQVHDFNPVQPGDGGDFFLPGGDGPGPGRVFVDNVALLRTAAAGTWIWEQEAPTGFCDPPGIALCTHTASGTGSLWTRVPEPSTLVLLGAGLAGLASFRRRKVS